jgi:hypothetical protein
MNCFKICNCIEEEIEIPKRKNFSLENNLEKIHEAINQSEIKIEPINILQSKKLTFTEFLRQDKV